MSAIHSRGEVLGWGSFAKVFHIWDQLLDRPVAVKELVQPFAGSEAFVRGYFAQALRMVDVAHPNLLAIYSVEPNRFPPVLTREMAEQPVAHRLFDGPLTPDEVARALCHALAGLGALHVRDLVHLSVRPENLLVSGEVYKLGDFGVSHIEGAPPIPPRQLRYSAPEMLGAEPRPAAAADLYSLGLVAWELLLGSERLERVLEDALGSSPGSRERPEGDRLWLAFHRSEAELPPIHEVEPAVPVALSLVLERLLRKDPAERPSSAREVLAALSPTAGEATEAAAASPEGAPTAPVSRKGATWLGLGVVAALVLAGVALWFGLRDRPFPSREGRDAILPVSIAEESRGENRPHTTERAPIDPGSVSAQSLAEDLRRMARRHPGLSFDLEPPRGGSRVRLPIGTDLRFRVDSDRRAFVTLFALSSTGTLTCLYPGPGGRAPEAIPGRRLILPRPEDERAGFELATTPPAGTDLVFLLTSDRQLPALPSGRPSGWVTDFPLELGTGGSPAARFARWVARLLEENPESNRLTLLQIEVVTGG